MARGMINNGFPHWRPDLIVDGNSLRTSSLMAWTFRRKAGQLEIPFATLERVEASHRSLQHLLESKIPIYGVTTGFGDSGSRVISFHQSEELQKNLVSYLLCGSGPELSPEVSRAILLIRLNSMCRGLSGVSTALVERMRGITGSQSFCKCTRMRSTSALDTPESPRHIEFKRISKIARDTSGDNSGPEPQSK